MIEGEVTKVNQYAEPGGFSTGNIKRYATIIKIKNPPPELRVGMNAEVRIHVERKPNALQVPVQALAELKGHYFTLAKMGDSYETREVKIGSTNDKVATIESGLKEGDEVVMNPRSAGSLLKLPTLPDPTPLANDEIKRTDPNEAKAVAAANAAKKEMTPRDMVARYLEFDADKDGKLSMKEEVSKMDERMQQRFATADLNNDGFLENRELLSVATNAIAKMKGKGSGAGGGGGRRGGGGEGGGATGGAGPAGGQ
jgi:hypothetical protein